MICYNLSILISLILFRQGVILKVPSLKNVVLQETDEEQDVDVTGDVTGDVTADNVLPIVSEQGKIL